MRNFKSSMLDSGDIAKAVVKVESCYANLYCNCYTPTTSSRYHASPAYLIIIIINVLDTYVL